MLTSLPSDLQFHLGGTLFHYSSLFVSTPGKRNSILNYYVEQCLFLLQLAEATKDEPSSVIKQVASYPEHGTHFEVNPLPCLYEAFY